jgi:hypothetical protein
MSKNRQSWKQLKRDPIKDLENLKEFILKRALMPREPRPLLISLKTYEFLQANCSDFLKDCKVITVPAPVPEPEPNQQ